MMKPTPGDIERILDLLTRGPVRLNDATNGIPTSQLHLRTEEEPWSVSDILVHLRACSDVWGDSIRAMLTQVNPTKRYVSPRSFMKKPKYQGQEFNIALESFKQEREKLVKNLLNLDEAGWLRPGTFTGTSPRQRNQTVFSLTERIVKHELPHLDQVESLLE